METKLFCLGTLVCILGQLIKPGNLINQFTTIKSKRPIYHDFKNNNNI